MTSKWDFTRFGVNVTVTRGLSKYETKKDMTVLH